MTPFFSMVRRTTSLLSWYDKWPLYFHIWCWIKHFFWRLIHVQFSRRYIFNVEFWPLCFLWMYSFDPYIYLNVESWPLYFIWQFWPLHVEFWPLHVVWIWTWQVTYVPTSGYPSWIDIHIGFTVVGLHVDLSLDLMVIFHLKSMCIMFMWLAREVLQNARAGNTYKLIELLFSLSSSCSGDCHIFVCLFVVDLKWL